MSTQWTIPVPLLIVLLLFYWFIYPVLILYCIYEFNKHIKSEFIRKRYPQITLISSIGVIFMITVNCPIILFYHSISESHSTHWILWNISVFTQPTAIYIALYALIWRLWHCYFDVRMTQNVLVSQWASIIDPNLANVNDWYLHHRNTFGSSEWVRNRIFILCTLSIVLSICVWSFYNIIGYTIAGFIDAALFLLPYIVYFILCLRTPSFGDLLHIRQEMTRVNLCILLNFMTQLILIAVSAVFPTYATYISLFMSFSACSWLLITMLFLTKWVLLHINKYLNKSTFENKINVRLVDIMNRQESFENFMDHLNKEYSLECILSYIECVQFIQHIVNNKTILNYDDTHLENKDMIEQNMRDEFKDFVPKSRIIYSFDEINIENIKKMAHRLFIKYIDENSYFEINISSILRSNFIVLMKDEQKWMNYEGIIEINALDNISNLSKEIQLNDLSENQILNRNINQLLLLFNEIVLEMYKLLSFSLSRFISNNQDEYEPRTPTSVAVVSQY
eukprot:445981_1